MAAPPAWVATTSFLYNSDFTSNGILTRTGADTYAASGTLSVAYGGTGSTTLSQYGLIYGNGTAQVGTTGQGANGLILQANGSGVPTWVSTTTLGFGSGNVGAATLAGQIPYYAAVGST